MMNERTNERTNKQTHTQSAVSQQPCCPVYWMVCSVFARCQSNWHQLCTVRVYTAGLCRHCSPTAPLCLLSLNAVRASWRCQSVTQTDTSVINPSLISNLTLNLKHCSSTYLSWRHLSAQRMRALDSPSWRHVTWDRGILCSVLQETHTLWFDWITLCGTKWSSDIRSLHWALFIHTAPVKTFCSDLSLFFRIKTEDMKTHMNIWNYVLEQSKMCFIFWILHSSHLWLWQFCTLFLSQLWEVVT